MTDLAEKVSLLPAPELPRGRPRLIVTGFMGTGKSSVGRLVADQLHFEFLDTDQVIETRTDKTITELFAQNGEPAFRELEHGAGICCWTQRTQGWIHLSASN